MNNYLHLLFVKGRERTKKSPADEAVSVLPCRNFPAKHITLSSSIKMDSLDVLQYDKNVHAY